MWALSLVDGHPHHKHGQPDQEPYQRTAHIAPEAGGSVLPEESLSEEPHDVHEPHHRQEEAADDEILPADIELVRIA